MAVSIRKGLEQPAELSHVKKSDSSQKKTDNNEEKSIISLKDELFIPEVIEATGGLPVGYVRTIDPFLYAIWLYSRCIGFYYSNTDKKIRKNNVIAFNIIFPEVMYTLDPYILFMLDANKKLDIEEIAILSAARAVATAMGPNPNESTSSQPLVTDYSSEASYRGTFKIYQTLNDINKLFVDSKGIPARLTAILRKIDAAEDADAINPKNLQIDTMATIVNVFIEMNTPALTYLKSNSDRIIFDHLRKNIVGNKVGSDTYVNYVGIMATALDKGFKESSTNIRTLMRNALTNEKPLVTPSVFNIIADSTFNPLDIAITNRYRVTEWNTNNNLSKMLLQSFIPDNDTNSRIGKFFKETLDLESSLYRSYEIFHKTRHTETEYSVVKKEFQKNIANRYPALTWIDLDKTKGEIGGFDLIKKKILAYKGSRGVTGESSLSQSGLLVGVQGTGKTHFALWTARILERDLYSMNISAMFQSALGSTEANVESTIHGIRQLGKIVLHIDEIEKVFGGVASSHLTDGGVLLRVMERIMNFLQDTQADIFIIMTANDISMLPAELLRPGRVSWIAFVDYPSQVEIEEIIAIRAKEGFGDKLILSQELISDLAKMFLDRCWYTGADIKAVFDWAKDNAVIENRNVNLEDIVKGFVNTQPNYEKQKEKIEAIRTEGVEKFEPASSYSESFTKYMERMNDVMEKAYNVTGDEELRKLLLKVKTNKLSNENFNELDRISSVIEG